MEERVLRIQMLLLSLPGGISKSEIMDQLYGWNERGDVLF